MVGRFLVPDMVWDIIAVVMILATGAWAIFMDREEEKTMRYIDYLLAQRKELDSEGARLAVTESGAVEYANEWKMSLPDGTVRDFVVKFDGWDKDDWTMWVRLPWGKYRERKAEMDFAVGRNIMKEVQEDGESH
ncbi:MAG: hypothetical protein IJT52_07670 [Spirochaetales bacterium]|nr:hypothetical protein [Spirochaetales bacterium]